MKIEPYLPDDLLNVSAYKDYYVIITYKSGLFKHGVADDETLNMMKDLNPAQYKIMMEGDEFDVSSELVLNTEPDLKKWKKLNII
ncbi:MAG: hypothetical protein J6T10_13390 [Methanobrevibacter sp.]|nr:hypothetical protein [Methanobrevibacter sp.]